jgi:hypothetical protein
MVINALKVWTSSARIGALGHDHLQSAAVSGLEKPAEERVEGAHTFMLSQNDWEDLWSHV